MKNPLTPGYNVAFNTLSPTLKLGGGGPLFGGGILIPDQGFLRRPIRRPRPQILLQNEKNWFFSHFKGLHSCKIMHDAHA